MRDAAIILAAGAGTRMGGAHAKQWQMLGGRAVLLYSLSMFRTLPEIGTIVVALPPGEAARAKLTAALAAAGISAEGLVLVSGGESRARSVHNALDALRAAIGAGAAADARVLIHDAARPFAGPALARRVLGALDHAPAAAPALSLSDALWEGGGGRVRRIVPRDGLYRAQTPQGFHLEAIRAAHATLASDPAAQAPADDVAVALAAGLDVAIVEGDEENFKLTLPGDMERAARLVAGGGGPRQAIGTPAAAPGAGGSPAAAAQTERAERMRIGTGFDVHAFAPGDHLWLCGLRIDHDRGLSGHSDADVGIHALCDAIYGALAEGDIGQHFPPSDPQWKGAASAQFLTHAAGRMRARGLTLGNCDVTLICESPRIGPHRAAMAARLAAIMEVEPARVSVKATTTEGLGFAGRKEGIAAMASVLMVPA